MKITGSGGGGGDGGIGAGGGLGGEGETRGVKFITMSMTWTTPFDVIN